MTNSQANVFFLDLRFFEFIWNKTDIKMTPIVVEEIAIVSLIFFSILFSWRILQQLSFSLSFWVYRFFQIFYFVKDILNAFHKNGHVRTEDNRGWKRKHQNIRLTSLIGSLQLKRLVPECSIFGFFIANFLGFIIFFIFGEIFLCFIKYYT